jgi:antitoxin component YwqK of YwqJK toxin-antitoxin module
VKALPLLVACLIAAANWAIGEEEPDLDDPKVRELIAKKAVLIESVDDRGPDGEELFYQASSETPYTGWAKGVHKNGQVGALCYFKDGKPEGQLAAWHENGKKTGEDHYKNGRLDVLSTYLREVEEGREKHYKDGKEVKE